MDSGKMKKLRLFRSGTLPGTNTWNDSAYVADSGSWQQDNEGRWKYITESGTAAAPSWLEADGNWYRIGEDGTADGLVP